MSSSVNTDLIIAVGDQLEFLVNGSESRTLTLDSYNASKLSALVYDATTRKLFFSDRRHRYGHIFSVKLDSSSRHPVEDIVESNLAFLINIIHIKYNIAFCLIEQKTVTKLSRA
jgi:hypothetical protein